MKTIYEVSLNYYVEEVRYSILYKQFTSSLKALEYAQSLLESILPTAPAEISIKVTPQD